ncbi:MAG TPA: protein translocase subunit SecD [Steroidobacteraceae bacterium]
MLEFSRWRYLLVIGLVLMGLFMAVPNLYGADPALQVERRDHRAMGPQERQLVLSRLHEHSIPVRGDSLEQDRLILSFASVAEQLRAQDAVTESLGQDYLSALAEASRSPAWIQHLGLRPMPLGLDLRGGLYLLYQVSLNDAVRQLLDSYTQGFHQQLADAKISDAAMAIAASHADAVPDTVIITAPPGTDAERLREVLQKANPSLSFDLPGGTDGPSVRLLLAPAQIKEREQAAITRNIEILRIRVNELGVAEAPVQQEGADRISVQLPGMTDVAEAKSILGKVATIEFHLVDMDADPVAIQAHGMAPVGSKLYLDKFGRPTVLKRALIVSGDQLIGATASTGDQGPEVRLTLNGRGGEAMRRATTPNVGRLMAVVSIDKSRQSVVVDGQRQSREITTETVINEARIEGPLDNSVRITGLGLGEARELALLLRSGSLAAPMYPIQEVAVGPSLGRENISKGTTALILGMATVFVFMLAYYRTFGLIADVALLVNVVLLAALLSLFKATLSLAGIAGMVLTVGMAVDANILIYERIREELRRGVSPRMAIRTGFERAFGTIADANVTALIAGVVLWMFGSSTIQGFAVVLTLGIGTSMFSAILVTRALVTAVYGGSRKLRGLSISWKWLDSPRWRTSFRFMSTRKLWYAISATLVVGSLTSLAIQGLNLGIDFTGGVTVRASVPGSANLDAVRTGLRQLGYRDATVTHFGSAHELMIRLPATAQAKGEAIGAQVAQLLRSVDSGAKVEQTQVIGAQVGRELQIKGAEALLAALTLIFIYVAFRFHTWRLSLGAVLAALHDPIVVLGFFSITRITFDLSVVAATLAVIGYSLNDTVVVFDRIRERFASARDQSAQEVLDQSVNQTLSRTVVTSGATLMVVVALLLKGGPVLEGFASALIVGIVVGTYSSIYIASAMALETGIQGRHLLSLAVRQPVDAMP